LPAPWRSTAPHPVRRATAGLDPVLTEQIGTVISDLKRLRITAIVVTHDLNLAAAVADRMGMIHEGG